MPCIKINEPFDGSINFCFSESVINFACAVESALFDSIVGLPKGINFEFDKPNRFYDNYDIEGCINFSGTTTDTSGRYYLRFYVTLSLRGSMCQENISVEIIDTLNQYFNLPRPYFEVIESGAVCNNTVQSVNDKQLTLQVTAYPNPAQEKITFSSTTYFNNATINIYNVLGKKVMAPANNEGHNIKLNINTLQNGVYLYEIIDNQERSQGRFYVNKCNSFLF